MRDFPPDADHRHGEAHLRVDLADAFDLLAVASTLSWVIASLPMPSWTGPTLTSITLGMTSS